MKLILNLINYSTFKKFHLNCFLVSCDFIKAYSVAKEPNISVKIEVSKITFKINIEILATSP